ncbi:pentapeptide repeat-containing protein [Lentzea sp. BCCO 10_0061]|uniref:Pentapeptide repeat-containing protein n=1 Tax=Lentzea sokolovensis TaxID=3095429 RepID=A0ABU4VA04_9PSEU|nr:pentapeptide repeat-containing protein [Lentzea sp. BCCO 10_0061]MDX8148631.1 pentapeptide repeat-containing protein [Lentzea sp. BCCO 10_0061]
MSLLSRWLTATSGVLTVAAVTWGRRRRTPGPVPVSPSPLQDIRARLLSAESDVRLGGLRDWVEHGESRAENRQPALDVLCEALRELPWPGTAVDQRWRSVLQASLAARLRPGPGFWLGSDVDLRRTTLVDFDLSECRLRDARFDGTRFLGDARFDQSTFLGAFEARGAFFGRHVLLTRSVFARGLGLRGSTVCGNGELSHIHVAGPAVLRGVRFSGRADFTCSRFGSELDCSRVRFGGRAVFRRAWFAGASSFAGSWFRGREDFVDAVFGGESSFENTRFGHRVHAD